MDNGLASWFKIWHPRYRGILVQLALAAAMAAALLYLQQSLLDLLTLSLASNPAAAPAGFGEPADKALTVLSDYAASLGLKAASLPLLVLGLFILVAVIASAVDYWKVRVTGRLRVRSEDDLESEILAHLLRKDDAFFARHSPSETVNRLAVDTYRTTENRPNVMLAVASAALIVSSLGYFLQKDWRLAGVDLPDDKTRQGHGRQLPPLRRPRQIALRGLPESISGDPGRRPPSKGPPAF
jgi:ABC-type multidrug transport system fused ATPase/permease subunit